MDLERTLDIIDFACDLKKVYGPDPDRIAEEFGIKLIYIPGTVPSGYTVKMPGYPTIATIRGCDSSLQKAILGAHELGHALLHDTGINRFSGTSEAIINNAEYEANLFAVALLFDEKDFELPFSRMNNYTLKSILDYNL